MRLSALSVIIMLTLVFSQVVKSEDGFVVDNIQVNGLQRISVGTVYNYLPVNIGDVFSSDRIPVAVRALFKTGFFKDITIERSGSTLVVNVVERPSIAKILFEGNKDISSEDLLKALKNIGLSEGKVFNQQILEKVEQELRRQYFSHGKYGLKIDTEVADLTRNRVGINIKISEGRVAKIKQINVVGNKTFDNDDLQKDFELSTSNLLSFYTKDDQYSKQKLSADLERLRSYYLDRGYINFNIESTQVAITPDKKEIYITINVKEGDVYTLEKVKLAGNLIVQPDEITKLVQVGPGEIFSRRNATETSKAISDRLGDDGYVFANVNMVPDINEADKTVAMTFFVDPGKRVYVNRINMRGNTKTRDEVLRRELRQMEASWASNTKIERSKTRLERLGYFEEVNVETPPVVGTSDQIDVNYTVVERPSGNLTAGVGFSQTQGIILNANISQDNVFGSGKRLNLAFNNSDVSTNYRFGFLNPYFTLDGISLGYELGYRSTDARQANIASYTTDVANAGMNFGIPLNEFDTLRFNADVKHTSLDTTPSSSREITDFIAEEGDSFLTFAPSIGWTHDTLNRFVFPTSGGQQRLSALATVPGSDLEYYKISYKQQEYFPIAKDLTFSLSAEAAYGDGYGKTDDLPFFENYFAGGVRSVRGFNDNTLGPRDSTNRPLGGSTKLAGSAELFFPVPFMKESKSIRLGTFIDAGMVDDSFSFNEMRYSAGISGEWLSPFGAISVSVAKPINLEDQDDERNFQFSFGSGF
ncbi:MAG: outer membrane protein assembly factor BamA [Methylicorpusculum sp.]|uniref:outer membrane protein assembly factor BamA n=1 Tax=Methylicorpusculum sp. TaxID=2713644 RepID=UPI002727B3E2|nr:outer membrane protein assembly factor BamA [Methylicorpusculum sp.]MDO8940746.1 outer membrane protein assembly factor BamA [Methylicorpusculum sp.]MDP2204080.1 outer membrane protein assembly factor BamA [Methylicorpusculum sp.]